MKLFHEPTYHHSLPVPQRVYVDLAGVLEEAVHEHGMLRRSVDRVTHVSLKVRFIVDDRHRAAAEHVGRADENRVADAGRDVFGFLERYRRAAPRLGDVERGEKRAETRAICGETDRVGGRP